MASIFLKHYRIWGQVFEARMCFMENLEIVGKKRESITNCCLPGDIFLRPENKKSFYNL